MICLANYVNKEQICIDKMRTCCFTGHRNRDLPYEGDINTQGMKNLISTVQLHCTAAYDAGCRYFITGMAEGVDIICGAVILDMMGHREYSDVRLICALPYAEQRREIKNSRERYIHSILLEKAEYVVVTGKIGDRGRYRERNRFMVDNSSRLIAVYREKQSGSGTLQTINMAKRAGLAVHVIELDKNPQFYIR